MSQPSPITQPLIDYCKQPRTMPEIEARFGTQGRTTVYNLVRRGQLANIGSHIGGHGARGLFVAASQAGQGFTPPTRAHSSEPRFDASALLAAWHPARPRAAP